jgi:hypothetical protein
VYVCDVFVCLCVCCLIDDGLCDGQLVSLHLEHAFFDAARGEEPVHGERAALPDAVRPVHSLRKGGPRGMFE